MSRIKMFFLCLGVLGLAGLLHHQWQIATPARAATLSNAVGSFCSGPATWHFVNNQTEGQCGQLTAYFSCNPGGIVSPTVNATKCLNSTDQYYVTTTGSCSLMSASTGSQPGKLVLSDFTCAPAPTPTPTPSPSPTPTP